MERIYDFERNNPVVSEMEIDGVRVWTIARFVLKFRLLQQGRGTVGLSALTRVKAFIRAILDFAKGMAIFISNIPRIFRRYDYVVVTSTLEVRNLDGQRVDKLAHHLVETLGQDRVLVLCGAVNAANRKHSYRHCVDASFLDLLAGLPGKRGSLTGEGKEVRQLVDAQFGLGDEVVEAASLMLRKARVFRKFLGIWKPRFLFSCCYSNYAEIFSSNRAGLETVELQHGIISPLHAGYEAGIPLDKSFTARWLWTFGPNSTRGLSGNLAPVAQTWDIGNFYLERIGSSPADPQLLSEVSRFEKTVCVPVDAYTEDHILQFLVPIARQVPRVGFFVNPRVRLSENSRILVQGLDNVIVKAGIPFQHLVRHCTLHTATDSTCCLEALSLGIPNLLINDNGSAWRYYGALTDPRFTSFAGDADSYLSLLTAHEKPDPEQVIASNMNNYSTHNLERIREGLAKIGAC